MNVVKTTCAATVVALGLWATPAAQAKPFK